MGLHSGGGGAGQPAGKVVQRGRPRVTFRAVFAPVDTRDVRAVEAEVAARWRGMFGPDGGFVAAGFQLFAESFDGRRWHRAPLDVPYHDREHTLQGTLCLGRLLHAWRRHAMDPVPDEATARLALLAILLHDTGYLKPEGDADGTGAKYMPQHESRSVAFVHEALPEAGLTTAEIEAVGRMIWCTSLTTRVDSLGFRDERELLAGCVVGTADLLGQMAAADYPEKLAALFVEFEESARRNGWSGGGASLPTLAELRRGTPVFWEKLIWPRLNGPLRAVYRLLNDPWPDGPNDYLARIHANLARLREGPA